MNNVERVNEAASNLRKTVISKLIFNDCMSCNAKLPETEELAWRAKAIYDMDVPTIFLERLFKKAREIIDHDNVPVSVNSLVRATKFIDYDFKNSSHPWGVMTDSLCWDSDANRNLIAAIKEEKCYPSKYTLKDPELKRTANV